MDKWISLAVAITTAMTAWTNYRTARLNARLAEKKVEESKQKEAAPVDAGSDR